MKKLTNGTKALISYICAGAVYIGTLFVSDQILCIKLFIVGMLIYNLGVANELLDIKLRLSERR